MSARIIWLITNGNKDVLKNNPIEINPTKKYFSKILTYIDEYSKKVVMLRDLLRMVILTSGVLIINIGHNVHCNMQQNLWNCQGLSGATKLPFFYFRCVCVYVFCITDCGFIGTKA